MISKKSSESPSIVIGMYVHLSSFDLSLYNLLFIKDV